MEFHGRHGLTHRHAMSVTESVVSCMSITRPFRAARPQQAFRVRHIFIHEMANAPTVVLFLSLIGDLLTCTRAPISSAISRRTSSSSQSRLTNKSKGSQHVVSNQPLNLVITPPQVSHDSQITISFLENVGGCKPLVEQSWGTYQRP